MARRGDGDDRARWLGLIPRPVRLALDPPARRAGEHPTAQPATHFHVPDLTLTEPGRQAATVPEIPEAGRVVTALRRPPDAPHGRIDLAGIVLDDQPAAGWTPGLRGPGEGILEERPFQAREVPLRRRLAVALQLPTYLLLEQSGPVEWPEPLFPYQLDGVRTLLRRDARPSSAPDSGARLPTSTS